MCGITGILQPAGSNLAQRAGAMTRTLVHRGPDGGDVWVDPDAGIALGHRRLAIIDLSPAGHQPMTSSCGRMVLSYNGEIYNAAELRAELEAKGRHFRGHSDTEVIVEGAAEWGLEVLLPHLIGMFALALWDREARRLTLVRDRFGIKPLYWSHQDTCLRFGSELKALTAEPDFDRTIDRNAATAYLRFGYVPAPRSIYRAAHKLAPGHLLEITAGGQPVTRPWWRLADLVREARVMPFTGSAPEAAEHLEALLGDAVRRRMYADVPLGVFLSGGIDSSAVTALMQSAGTDPVKSFTIGFDVPGFDEATHAQAVAAHLGTDHQTQILTPQTALDLVPELTGMQDEPFADPSLIPTWLVSRMTRRDVTVALSGDGGDEIFTGYNRYVEAAGRLGRLWSLPGLARRAMAGALDAVPDGWWPHLTRVPLASDKATKLARALRHGPREFYRGVVSTWHDPDQVVPGGAEEWAEAWGEAEALCPDPVERMMYLDALTYMTDDILTKVDRASMAVSLEVRVPLMDHRVAAFAWSLPMAHRLSGGQGKRVLRQVLEAHVPRALTDRPKHGFAVPLRDWLRGPLADWAEGLLNQRALEERGLMSPGRIQPLWKAHRSGRADHGTKLWTALMLQSFAEKA